MGRGTLESKAQVEAFARWAGLGLCRARVLRREKEERWLEWCRVQEECCGVTCQAREEDVQEALPTWKKARRAANSAWRALVALQERMEQAAGDEAVSLAVQVQRARDTWEKAEDYAARTEKEAGVLIHVENLQSVKKRVIIPLAQGIRSMRNAIAVRLQHATPEAVSAFFAAWDAEKGVLARQCERLNDEMEAILNISMPKGGSHDA